MTNIRILPMIVFKINKTSLQESSHVDSPAGQKLQRKGKENMKKLTKRLVTVALTGAMVLSMGVVPSFAAQGNDGEIIITNPSVDVTYSAYKIFDMDYDADDGNYAYTIDGNSVFFSTVWDYAGQIKEDDTDPDGLTLTQVGTSTTYNVTVDESKFSAAAFGAALKGVTDKGNAAATENDTTTTKNLTLSSELAYGYYLVIGTTGSGEDVSIESLVSLDSTNKVAEIVEKNDAPGWHPEDPNNPDDAKGKTIKIAKKDENGNVIEDQYDYVETTDMNIGDEVTFAIKIDAKNYNGKNLITKYIIKDSLPDGFTFGEIKSVKVGAKELSSTGMEYIDNGFPEKDGTIGSIEIPWATGSDEAGWTSTYDPSTVITIEYTATLDKDAVIDGPGNVNTAAFTYEYGKTPENPDPEDPPEIPKKPDQWTDTDTAKVYTYAIALKKINKSGDPLAGAIFGLPQGMTVSEAKDAEGNAIPNTYVVDKDGTITSITTSTDSGADASFTIIGLAAGKYNLTETKAPDGYNKLTSPVSVEAQKIGETTTETTKIFYLDENGNIVNTATETTKTVTYTNDKYAVTPVAVVNFTGTELPSTGGVGTSMFYVIGIICVAGAAILLVSKKRMSVR